MSITREQVSQALFSLITSKINFSSQSRRLRAPEAIDPEQQPAFFLVEHLENFERRSPALPAKRIWYYYAIVSMDAGADENVVPVSTVNNLLDQIEAALAPDDRSTNCCRLSGLVESVIIEGDVIKASGDVTGKAEAMVPIRVVVP